MAHLESYDSFQTKKSREKKQRAREKTFQKKKEFDDSFIIKRAEEYGIVIEVNYNEATILWNGKLCKAKLRNGLNTVCNQTVFPGDKVVLEKINEEDYIINNLIKRSSVLTRTKKDSTRIKDSLGTKHIIATNVDVAVIVVSAYTPPLHPKFIDRYLMLLENSGIDTIICLNKSDLKTEKDEEILDIYRKIKIPVIETSVSENVGIEELKKQIKGKQAIFVGHSGVGKSSLTNSLMNTEEIKTSHTSKKSLKGRHTTTSSKYYIWEENSSIIDTPGIRSLDISHFKPNEIKDYFPEFKEWESRCKYSNCLHYKEPIDNCMVKQATESGIINKGRYESYIRILKDIVNEKENEDEDEFEK